MKVILKDEVDNLGLPGDVVDVADGYGRNFLLPRGLAIRATKGAMKEAEALTRARKTREAETVDDARAFADVITSRTLRIPVRVDDRGHLYGSVGAGDIQRVLKERGHDVDRKRIELKGTIKQVGSYEIPVQVHPQVTATVTVEVVDEEGRIGIGGVPEVSVDEEAVTEAAAQAGEGSETDLSVLEEQALEAARSYEAEQARREAAGLPTAAPDADVATEDEAEATGTQDDTGSADAREVEEADESAEPVADDDEA